MLLRNLEQKIVNDINDSGMPIDAIYFIMKSLMREVEEKYFEQCQIEDAAAAQSNEESRVEEEKPTPANENEEGTN